MNRWVILFLLINPITSIPITTQPVFRCPEETLPLLGEGEVDTFISSCNLTSNPVRSPMVISDSPTQHLLSKLTLTHKPNRTEVLTVYREWLKEELSRPVNWTDLHRILPFLYINSSGEYAPGFASDQTINLTVETVCGRFQIIKNNNISMREGSDEKSILTFNWVNLSDRVDTNMGEMICSPKMILLSLNLPNTSKITPFPGRYVGYRITIHERRKLLGLIPIDVKKEILTDSSLSYVEERKPVWYFLTTD